jgi:hypothetical protein
VTGSTLVLLLNAAENAVVFRLPGAPAGWYWEEVVDAANGVHPATVLPGGSGYPVPGRSSAVLCLRREKRRPQPGEPEREGEPALADESRLPAPASAARDEHDDLVRAAR